MRLWRYVFCWMLLITRKDMCQNKLSWATCCMAGRDMVSAINPSSKLNCSENVNAWSQRMWQELPTTTAPFKCCFWFASRAISFTQRMVFILCFQELLCPTLFNQFFLHKHSMPEGGASLHLPRRKSFLLYFITDIYTLYIIVWLILWLLFFFFVCFYGLTHLQKGSQRECMSGPCVALCGQLMPRVDAMVCSKTSMLLWAQETRVTTVRTAEAYFIRLLWVTYVSQRAWAQLDMKSHVHTAGHLTHQQPIELFGASSFCLSCRHLKFCFKCPRLHSACNKTCMLNLLVCTSQCWASWHPCFLEKKAQNLKLRELN